MTVRVRQGGQWKVVSGSTVSSLEVNVVSSAYTLSNSDIGKLVKVNNSSSITVPASTFVAGQNVTIYNNSTSSLTIVQGTSVILRVSETSDIGDYTLEQRGLINILCVANNEFVIESGAGGGGVDSTTDLQINSLGVGTPASGTVGEIRATDNITAYYSDDRLKTKLGNIENAVEKVCKLNGFYYEANEVAQSLGYKVKREVGVSAQEVEEILPEIVTEAPISSEYKTIYYDKLIPLLIEAIKEQNESIESLKEEIRKLKE